MLYCACGYSCGIRAALDRHLSQFAGDDMHREGTGGYATKPVLLPVLCRTNTSSVSANSKASDAWRVDEAFSPCKSRLSFRSPSSTSIGSSPVSNFVSPSSAYASTPSATPFGAAMRSPKSSSSLTTAGRASLMTTPSAASASSNLPASASGFYQPVRLQPDFIRILFVRHAQSANRGRAQGERASGDPDLTDLGYDQADALGKRLGQEYREGSRNRTAGVMVVSSPMRRCLLTIQPAVRELKIAKQLCLCHGGFYEFGCAGKKKVGTNVEEIDREFQEFETQGFTSDGWWDYQGTEPKETPAECKARGQRIVDWLKTEGISLVKQAASKASVAHVASPVRRNEKASGPVVPTLVFCTHQTLADLLCQLLLRGSADKWEYGEIKHKLSNAALTEILLYSDGRAEPGLQNSDVHLLMCGASTYNYKQRLTRSATCI